MRGGVLFCLGVAVLLGGRLLHVRWRNAGLLSREGAIPQDIRPPLAPAQVDAVRSRIVQGARSLVGQPYDPLMGRRGDPLGPWGFIVCVDVPVRAYRYAGVSLPELLRESALDHPEWFQISMQNGPADPFFYRRVRNYYDLFRNHPALEFADSPAPGDLAFFGRWHIGLVTDVSPDGRWQAVESTPRRWGTAEGDDGYLLGQWGKPHFFGRLRTAGGPPSGGRRAR